MTFFRRTLLKITTEIIPHTGRASTSKRTSCWAAVKYERTQGILFHFDWDLSSCTVKCCGFHAMWRFPAKALSHLFFF